MLHPLMMGNVLPLFVVTMAMIMVATHTGPNSTGDNADETLWTYTANCYPMLAMIMVAVPATSVDPSCKNPQVASKTKPDMWHRPLVCGGRRSAGMKFITR